MSRNKEFDIDAALLQAMDLFWYKGYEKTSIQDLVNHMGIHRKSLYDTFGDKHELFMAAVDRYHQIVKSDVEKELKDKSSAKEMIRSLFSMVINQEKLQSRGCLIINMAVELALHDEEALEKSQKSLKEIEACFYKLILLGQQIGEIPQSHDASMLAPYLVNAWTGLRVMVKTGNTKSQCSHIIDMTLKILD